MLCSMSYYPRLLPTHLLIMDPYSPKIAHKIYKCDNKTNIEELFIPLQMERTLMIRKEVYYLQRLVKTETFFSCVRKRSDTVFKSQ